MPPALAGGLLLSLAPGFLAAQGSIPAGYDIGPVRVLSVRSVEGAVGVQREGQTVPLEAGAALGSQDSVMASPDSRAQMSLGRYGGLEFVPVGGYGSLTVEKLPFSSWAADLSTELKVDGGALRLRWRPTANTRWPLTVNLGPWRSEIGAGEFLIRGDQRRGEVCNLAGWIELRDELQGFRAELRPGECFVLRDDDLPEKEPLVVQTWANWWPESSILVGEATVPPFPSGERERAEPAVRVVGESSAPVQVARAPEIVADDAVLDSTAVVADVAAKASPVSQAREPSRSAPVPGADYARVPSAPGVIESPDRLDAKKIEQQLAPPSQPSRAVEASSPAASAATAASEPPTAAVQTEPSPSLESTPESAGAEPSESVMVAPPPIEGPEWIVNVMTVTNRTVAVGAVERLREAGYDGALRSETVRGRSSYRVIVAGIESESEAYRTVSLLQTKMGFRGAWALQKR